MKKIFSLERARSYWKQVMHSTNKKLSRGSENIVKFLSWARNESWRRGRREHKK